MAVTHATVFTQCQALAAGLQLFLAFLIAFACGQTLRCLFMGASHGAVAFNVFTLVLIQLVGGSVCCRLERTRWWIAAVAGPHWLTSHKREQSAGDQRFHGENFQGVDEVLAPSPAHSAHCACTVTSSVGLHTPVA